MPVVRYFAAAAEAAGCTQEEVQGRDLGSLLSAVRSAHGAQLEQVLNRSSVLVDGEYTEDARAQLSENSVVDVLPPFAGG